ncbi:hypothetical protein Tco_0721255 [Tanacetum coccineum]
MGSASQELVEEGRSSVAPIQEDGAANNPGILRLNIRSRSNDIEEGSIGGLATERRIFLDGIRLLEVHR